MTKETEIIVRCQRGDRASFVALFTGYRDRAYRFCLGMVGNPQESHDIVQEAFLAAFKGIDRLQPENGFAGWFYGILRHLCFASIRQRGAEIQPQVLDEIADEGDSPEETAEQAERRVALTACMAALTPTQREVLLLREFEGHSYSEIAVRLDIPQGTVMSRLYDARHALRKQVQKSPSLRPEVP